MMDLEFVAIVAGSAVAAAQVGYFALRRQANKLEARAAATKRSEKAPDEFKMPTAGALRDHLTELNDIALQTGSRFNDRRDIVSVGQSLPSTLVYRIHTLTKSEMFGPIKPKKDGVKS